MKPVLGLLLQVSPIDLMALAIFSFWLLVSILYQLKFVSIRWVNTVKYHDDFALIPAWSFFAPNPGVTDLHLLFRDRLADENVTMWKEIRLRPSPVRAFWNPEKRLQKGISDMGNDLHRYAARHVKRGDLILIHPAFIALLNFVSHQPHSPFAEQTQFTVARSFGQNSDQEAEVMVLSSFHRLPGAARTRSHSDAA